MSILSTPTMQVTVSLTPETQVWSDAFLDGSPLLAIESGHAELCLVLDADEITDEHVAAARKLAAEASLFARAVQRQHALYIAERCRLEAVA